MRAILSRIVSLFARPALKKEDKKTRRSLRTSQPETVKPCVTLVTGDLSIQTEHQKRTKQLFVSLRTENDALAAPPPKDEIPKKPKKVPLKFKKD
jgi:hypothetical protein